MKMDGVSMLRRYLETRSSRVLRRFMCKWRDHCVKRETQQEFLFQIMQRKKKRGLRHTFIQWLGFCKK